ncbi:CPBP family glutamic-type intramembrane protease [Tsuneonella sp. YG55]|uniref:CPBP family glutamic-type intramembrane protease n=1 Tax=Tsuneonella litorea TaxID=2976475 RepID=A0A9X2W2Q9_9SPHN|nr:CPBP family glutamic-type intramembrane protease [Tsuneonella litorea]MCT2560022.1 CPBP family glutamic-type intramembrane protease [Tsuneonella litorea]
MRQPALPDRAVLNPRPAFTAVFSLFGLDLALMALLLGVLSLALQLGFQMPAHMLDQVDLKPGVLAFIVLGAPIAEEIVFRGWLSGRIGHILASPLAIAALIALPVAGTAFEAGDMGRAQGFLGAGAVAAALAAAALFLFRKRKAIGFVQRRFAWFYWASVIAFAGIHLTNFAAAGVAALPLVLPQFLLAMILGYLRVTFGLWSSMLAHVLHNALFIALVLAGAG